GCPHAPAARALPWSPGARHPALDAERHPGPPFWPADAAPPDRPDLGGFLRRLEVGVGAGRVVGRVDDATASRNGVDDRARDPQACVRTATFRTHRLDLCGRGGGHRDRGRHWLILFMVN